MSILSRYILRQHVGPFFFGFSIIALIFILNLLFRELNRILSKGLPLQVVGEFFLLNMGWIVALAVPMAMLTASLMAFGRMSADNEITAIKACGISMYRLILPVTVAATLLAIFLIWYNNAVLPESNHRLALLIRDISRKKPTINIEPGVWYDDLNNYGLLVSEIEDSGRVSIVRNVLINDYSRFDVTTTITASHGYIQVNEKEGLLEFLLFDGEMQEINIKRPEEFRRLRFPRHIVRIDITDRFLKRSESSARGDREKSAAMMRKEIAEARTELAKKQATIDALMGWYFTYYLGDSFGLPKPNAADSSSLLRQFLNVAPESPGVPAAGNPSTDNHSMQPKKRAEEARRMLQLRALQRHRTLKAQIRAQIGMIRSYKRRINSLSVEIHKKYSIPIACVVFVLIGAPLGVMARSGGLGVGGGISLGFFLLYWASLIGGEDLADRGIISPFWAMWSANLIVGIAGVYLLIQSVRETRFIQFHQIGPYLRENWLKFLLIGFLLKRKSDDAAS